MCGSMADIQSAMAEIRQLSHTTQHITVLLIFPLILQTIIIAQMMSSLLEMRKPVTQADFRETHVRHWWHPERHLPKNVQTMPKMQGSHILACECGSECHWVSWSLMSHFSTNTAISKTKGMESYPYPVKEGQRYINLNPGHLFVQQPPKKGKGIERLI